MKALQLRCGVLLAVLCGALPLGPTPAQAQTLPVSVRALSERSVINYLTSGDCPVSRKPGTVDAPCFNFYGKSIGETCLTFKVSEGGVQKYEELACAYSCGGGTMRNTNQCSDYPCYTAVANKPYFLTFAALDSATQQKMAGDYGKLIALVRAEIANQKAAYTALGGDGERARLKFEILGFVIGGYVNSQTGEISKPGTMLPFGQCLLRQAVAREGGGNAEVAISKQYGQTPQVSTGNPADASPMDTSASGTLHLFESAFLTCARVTPSLASCLSGVAPASPDSLAASIIHELVHCTQAKFGHEAGAGGLNDDTSGLKTLLNEIMAYGVSRDNLFYRFALTPSDYNELTGPGLAAQIRAFQKEWAASGPTIQEEVAAWAWGKPWMRSRMVRTNRPVQEGVVWNLTCTAMHRRNRLVASLCSITPVH